MPLSINAVLEEEQRLPMTGSQKQVELNEHLRRIVQEIRMGNPAEEIIRISHLIPFDLNNIGR
jgi:hypothetical protein